MGKTILRITTIPMALKVLLEGQMKYMGEHGFKVIMVSSDGKEREDLVRNENCPHVIVEMTRKITPFRDLMSLFRLIRVIKKYKPEIVHTHTPKAGLLGMIAAMICLVRIRIHTVAGLPLMVESGTEYQLLKLVERITYLCATNVWPNSKSLLEYIRKKGLTRERKLSIILNGSSNGIDLKRFNRESLNQEKTQKIKSDIQYSSEFTYLLFAGRIVKDKGIAELILAFRNLIADNPNLRLILIGTYEKNLDPIDESIVREIDYNSSIIKIDWTDYMEYYMAISDFCVFPSHREGFPNVLLQAGAMSLPIICSNIAGNVDLIQHEKTGFLFECNDEESMSKMISYALKNRDMAKNCAALLKEKIQGEFDRTAVHLAILKEYNRLLEWQSA